MPAGAGKDLIFGEMIFPENPVLRQAESVAFGNGNAWPVISGRPFRRVSDPEGRPLFTDTMSAAIDGARTLTRLDHLSKAIWQGLTAGAVGDDDAQALAERLHTRRSLIRGEIKPVSIPVGRPSIFPPRRP